MKVVILAGGFGTRISEESQFKPKPMIEIGGKPILWHIMKWVSIRPRACFFPLFSFLPLWLHYNLNPLCVQY